jgi:hypothetical protein
MRKIAFLMMLVTITVVAGVKVSPARSATRAVALLDALPDGTAVAVIDFQKIAGSGLWAAINAQDKLKSEIDKAQSEMADLGVKLTDVHTVALVFSGAGLNSPTLALAGGFEQNDLLARLRASGKVKLTSEKYKDIDIYKVRSIAAAVPSKELSAAKAARAEIAAVTKNETSFVFYDANTLVTGSMDAVRASIDVKTGARPGLTQNSKLVDALAQNPTAAIRFAFALSPAVTSGLQAGDLPVDFSSITLIFGTIDVGAGIDLNATLRSDNAEHAKSISERLNALLTMASGLLGSMGNAKMAPIAEALKTVSITSAEADVKITGNLPMELLNSLLSSSAKKGQ